MKLIIDYYQPWLEAGIDGGLKMVKEAGFDGIDLGFYHLGKALCGLDYEEKALEIRTGLQKYGLVCNQAHAPYDCLYGMAHDKSCEEYANIVRSIKAAGIIGVDHIVVEGVEVPAPADSELNLKFNYDYYRTLEPVAEESGVKIAVENLKMSFTYPELMNEILRRLNSPWFVALCDVGHCWCRAGIQPGDWIRRLDPGVLKGLHIQDTTGLEAYQDLHIVPFLAEIDFRGLMKALKEVGYDGDFTFEIGNFLKKYREQGLLQPALQFAEAIGRELIKG